MEDKEYKDTYKYYRSVSNLESGERWKLLIDYISLKMSTSEIADKYEIKKKSVDEFITKLYKRFQQARETNTLLSTRNNPDLFQVLKERHVDSDYINKSFFSLLSDPTSLVLTDNELIFCELHMEYGDDFRAIEESKLNIGLGNEKKKTGPTYREACLLRAFYLKKKPNIAEYINKSKKSRLTILSNGKEYLQEQLISMIEQLRNTGDKRNLTSLLKATEQLGRTIGAFDDKMTVNTFDGDQVLDTILERAKRINSKDEEESSDSLGLIAYADGEYVHERQEERE